MDDAKAIEFLTIVRNQAEQACIIQDRTWLENDGWYRMPPFVELDAHLEGVLGAVRTIIDAIDPRLLMEIDVGPDYAYMHPRWANMKTVITRALGVLEHRSVAQAIVGPTGPRLAAERFHSWVWQPAIDLWSDGHRRMAIQAAAERVDLAVRSKINRLDLAGKTAAAYAWGDAEPKPGETRLRPNGFAPGTPEYTSALEGARSFAMGCMQRIRNIATHTAAEPSEQEALEQLAALSVLARWIDDADVITG